MHLAIVMFLAAMLLAFRTEVNASNIDHQQLKQDTYNWAICKQTADTTNRLNVFLRGMGALERRNHFVNQALRDERVKLYTSLILIPPDCGPRP